MGTDASRFLLLLNWMSPTFPVGGFAYSHGLEQAIADGVQSAEGVRQWISALVETGSARNDAVLFARCWHDDPQHLNALALALCSSAERHRETTQLGHNFERASSTWLGTGPLHADYAYPIAAGVTCATAGIDREQALLAFLHGFCAAQVSVAVRLVPLGQTNGLEIMRDLAPVIADTVTFALHANLEDLGSASILADIASMKHETLEPRIFLT